MSMRDRAGQFAPFAALTGYEASIAETSRYTEDRIQLDEDSLAELDNRLRILSSCLSERPEITVTYFQPDTKKKGGSYVKAEGKAETIDTFSRMLCLDGNRTVPFDAIIDLQGACFETGR